MGLIYAPNTTRWHVGDFVIHDADAKRADMLMVVTGCSREGIYRTRYAFPEEQPRSWRRKVWRNTLPPLHEPGRFAIDVPHLPVMPAASASSPCPLAATPPRSVPSATS